MARSRFTAWSWVAALAIIAGGPAACRAGFTITDLGVVVSTGTSGATAINGNGVTSGMVTNPTLAGVGMIAASSASGTLQTVGVPSGTTSSIANAINGSNTVAGYFQTQTVAQEGFYTSAGGSAVPIGFLSVGTAMGTSSVANGINDGNQVVGTGNVPGGVSSRAFVDNGGVLTMIAPIGNANAATSPLKNWANGINSSGTVVGTSELFSGGVEHAFYTGSNGQTFDLTTRNASGNFQSSTFGTAIDKYGDIVGSGYVGNNLNAFYADAAGDPLVALGTLTNATTSQGLGLNDNGLVVGTSGNRAFLWGASEGMADLNSLIPMANQANWVLTEATGINNNGQISGEGYLNGVLHGFVLTPIPGESFFTPPGQTPTPPALALSAVGLAIVCGWSRLRSRNKGPAVRVGG